MRQLPKKLTALLAAASLCLAAPVGALADTPSVLYTFAEEYQAALSEPLEITTFDDDGTAAAATVSTEDNKTTVTETGYYTLTIPATVSVSDASKDATFTLSGTLEKYRELTITVSTGTKDEKGNDCLKCGSATLPYTLSAKSDDGSLTIDNAKREYSAESDATEKTFSANLSVKLDTDANPSVSGEYKDTLTFTMDCKKTTTTIHVLYETVDSTKSVESGSAPDYPRVSDWEEHTTENMEVIPGDDPLSKTIPIAIKGDETTNLWENTSSHVTWNAETKQYEAYFYRKMCSIDLNGAVWDGQKYQSASSSEHAAANIYLDGKQITSGPVKDFYTGYSCGMRYEFKDFVEDDGYELIGWTWGSPETNERHTWTEGEEKIISGVLPGENNGTPYPNKTYGAISVYLIVKAKDSTDTQGSTAATPAEQSLTITDTMRDYFADLYPEDDAADTDAAAEDAEPTTTETPETTPDDGYDSYDDYVVDEYPVVFFETDR